MSRTISLNPIGAACAHAGQHQPALRVATLCVALERRAPLRARISFARSLKPAPQQRRHALSHRQARRGVEVGTGRDSSAHVVRRRRGTAGRPKQRRGRVRHDSNLVNDGKERAGVIVVSDGRLALIKRVRNGQLYYAVPGGGIEQGESLEQAAQREAEEELGVGATLGALRVSINHREEDGSFQQQWYFDATLDSDDIKLVGPELNNHPRKGTYEAVWVRLEELRAINVLPKAVAMLAAHNQGVWADELIEIDEAAAQS
jgi:8-oxo-dGTP pyrophosphatase MutT (NUDIX family)